MLFKFLKVLLLYTDTVLTGIYLVNLVWLVASLILFFHLFWKRSFGKNWCIFLYILDAIPVTLPVLLTHCLLLFVGWVPFLRCFVIFLILFFLFCRQIGGMRLAGQRDNAALAVQLSKQLSECSTASGLQFDLFVVDLLSFSILLYFCKCLAAWLPLCWCSLYCGHYALFWENVCHYFFCLTLHQKTVK